jgi:hypothetical protein
MAGRNATTPICQAAVAKLGQVGRLQSHVAGGKWSFGRDDTSVRRYTSKYGVAEAVWGRCLKRRDLQAIPASGEHPNLPFYFIQHMNIIVKWSFLAMIICMLRCYSVEDLVEMIEGINGNGL